MLNFQTLFESIPEQYLVLSLDFVIVGGSNAYFQATMTKREAVIGTHLFEVFPDNPDDPNANGVQNLRVSLESVLKSGKPHTMAVQKYDVRRPESLGGGFEERYWSPINSPVFDETRKMTHIIHRVEDVTEFVQMQQQGNEQRQLNQALQFRTEQMESEIYLRAQELRAVNAAIQRSEERSRLAIGIARLGTWQYDPNTHLIELDERLCEIWGEPEDAGVVPLSQIMERIHPGDRARVSYAVEAALAPLSSGAYKIDYRIIWDDGTERWISANGQATFAGEGELRQVVAFLGTAFDITDYKRSETALQQQADQLKKTNEALQNALEELQVTEEELRQQNEELAIARELAEVARYHYQDLFNSAPDGYVVTDAQGIIQEANQAIAALIGIEHSFLVNTPLVIYLYEKDRRALRNVLYELHQPSPGHKLQTDELSLNNSGGQPIPVAMMGTAIRDAQGEIVGVRWLIQNITVRKQAEQMLIEQKRLLELIATGNPLEDCLKALCASVSHLNPRARACFLLIDAQGQTFPRSITPDLPPSFGQGLKDAPINDLCIGTCGEAVYRGQPITCADIANDECWSQEWRDLCIAHGILACHSTPVFGRDGLPLGSLMLCFEEARMPSDWEYQLAEFGTQVASIVFERDRSIHALRESEHRYRRLFESIDEGFCLCEMLFDENGKPTDYRFLEVNPAFATLTGLQQAAGKTARELIPKLEAFWFETYGRVILTGKPVRFENQSVAMNRWFDVNAFCIGKPLSNQFAVLFTNITERQQFEQERERFLAVGSDLQVLTSTNGYFQWVSPTFERTLGWTPEEMTSRPWTDFVHPDDISASETETDNLLLGNETLAFENRYRHKDGSYRWLLWKAQPYPAEQAIYGAAVDITERKQAEERVRESEEKLRLFVEHAPAAIAMFDRQMRYLVVSQRWMQDYNLRGNIIGCNHYEVFPDIPKYWQQIHQRCLAGAVEKMDEDCFDRADGSVNWLKWEIRPWFDATSEVGGIVIFSEDITKRKSAEAALRVYEERLRSFVEADVVGLLFGDIYGNIYQANDELLRIVGYSREDLEAGRLRWIDITPPEYLPLDEQRIAEARERGACTPYEKEYIRADGSRVPVLVGYNLLGEAREESVAFILDLTQRKQTEAALRQSESRFRLMVESAKDYAIFTLDLNGKIASWNSGAERLLGYTETEAIGCDGRMIFTPEDNEQGNPEREMQLTLTQGRAKNERWHLRKDGSRFWASGLMMPLQTEAGSTQGFVKIMQDKTAQRRSDERLHLLYETTRDLLATEHPLQLMSNLFSKLSAQLELHYYYNYMIEEKDNRLMLHLKNYEGISEEMAQVIEWIELGQYLCGLVAQERRQIVFDQAQLSTHPNAHPACEMGITAYAGQPLIVQGRLLGTLAFASRSRKHFTTEEIDLLQSTCEQMAIALERATLITSLQQQAEQLQQTNRIKDEFLAVLSHELRSPLNPILGWSKLLQTGKLNSERTAQALSVIERNAKLQAELIEDLLDVSRILQGKLSLNVYPVALAPTIRAAIETVRLAAQAKSIQIQTQFDPDVGQVWGDANRLQQVLWNLLSNAVKFTPEGGRVEVKLKKVMGKGSWVNRQASEDLPITDSRLPMSESAKITVTDTGKGIHPDFLPHVFDYFRQEDSATTRRFGGLGLGLAIVRHLVELHGGTVGVESAGEGQGAIFTVKLPLMPNPPQIQLDSNSFEPSLNLAGIKVLVVDDTADTREFLSFLLETYGANVITVASAVEALTALAEFKPDILVSDIGMPEMDGYMLLRQLRALPPEQGGQIPAIALTAYAGEIDYQQAIAVGFQKHVAKPVEPAKLVEAIANLVESNATQS